MSKERFVVQDYSRYDSNKLKQLITDAVGSMLPESTPERVAVLQNIGALDSSNANLEELKKAAIVTDIVKHIVSDHAVEVMKGAHIIIDDGGDLYDQLVAKGVVSTRVSSHHKDNKADSDVSLQAGEVFREFLVGKTKDGKTWFQVEAHSATTSVSLTTIPKAIKDLILHLVDFIQYKWTGKNVGQYGLSEHTDKNPIIVRSSEELHKTVRDVGTTLGAHRSKTTNTLATNPAPSQELKNKWRDL